MNPTGASLDAPAPLRPPEGELRSFGARPSSQRSRSGPARPPIYDPSHYGYGPRAGRDDGYETDDLPDITAPPPRRLRTLLLAASAGAIAAMGVVLLTLWVVADDGPQRVENVFEFPETPDSTSFDGETLDIQAVLAKVRPSVVTIITDNETRNGVFEGAGSGVIISEDGLVLTNAHVIQGADNIQVTIVGDQTFEADLVGSFPDDDIAVIQMRDVDTGLRPAELGTSENLLVGDDVVAIGNALNLGDSPSVTKGIVSAKGRTIEASLLTLENLIQTDAAINPGNSGGPLIDARGTVVGINTAIIDNAQSIGFAISIDVVKPLIERATNGEADLNPDTAFLGVTTISLAGLDPTVGESFGVTSDEGAFVQEVIQGSPAESVGIERGDVVLSISGETTTSAEDVARTVRDQRPGDTVEIRVERAGDFLTFDAELSRR